MGRMRRTTFCILISLLLLQQASWAQGLALKHICNGEIFVFSGDNILPFKNRINVCNEFGVKLAEATRTQSPLIHNKPSMMVSIQDINNKKRQMILGGFDNDKLDVETQSRLGSISKSLIAVLAFIIGLDPSDTLSDYLTGEELNLFESRERAASITIEQLLTHRSGLQENIQLAGKAGEWGRAGMEDISLDARFFSEGSIHKYRFMYSDNKFHYSNLGYDIVGMVLERKEKMRLLEMLEHYLFKLIGMTRTTRVFFDKNHLPTFDPDGYKNPNGDRDFETDLFNTPSGGMRSTIYDMNLFYEYLYEISKGHKKLGHLNQDTFGRMIKVSSAVDGSDVNNYAMGFHNNGGIIGHDGMNGSYLATGSVNLNTGVSTVGFVNAMSNSEMANPDSDSIIPIVKKMVVARYN